MVSRGRLRAGATALLVALSWGISGGCEGPNPAFTGTARPNRGDASGEASGSRLDAAPPRPPIDGGAVAGPDTRLDLGESAPDVSADQTAADMAIDGAAVIPDARPPDAALPDVRMTPDAAPPAPDGPAPLSRYDFENGTDEWRDIRFDFYEVPEIPVVSSSAIPAHRGARVLEMTLRTPSASVLPTFGVRNQSIRNLAAGTRIRFWVWFPVGAPLEGVQAFIYYYQRGKGPHWGGQLTVIGLLTPGAWNALDREVPADVDYAAGGIVDFGIEWNPTAALTQPLRVYVDDVTVTPP